MKNPCVRARVRGIIRSDTGIFYGKKLISKDSYVLRCLMSSFRNTRVYFKCKVSDGDEHRGVPKISIPFGEVPLSKKIIEGAGIPRIFPHSTGIRLSNWVIISVGNCYRP